MPYSRYFPWLFFCCCFILCVCFVYSYIYIYKQNTPSRTRKLGIFFFFGFVCGFRWFYQTVLQYSRSFCLGIERPCLPPSVVVLPDTSSETLLICYRHQLSGCCVYIANACVQFYIISQHQWKRLKVLIFFFL